MSKKRVNLKGLGAVTLEGLTVAEGKRFTALAKKAGIISKISRNTGKRATKLKKGITKLKSQLSGRKSPKQVAGLVKALKTRAKTNRPAAKKSACTMMRNRTAGYKAAMAALNVTKAWCDKNYAGGPKGKAKSKPTNGRRKPKTATASKPKTSRKGRKMPVAQYINALKAMKDKNRAKKLACGYSRKRKWKTTNVLTALGITKKWCSDHPPKSLPRAKGKGRTVVSRSKAKKNGNGRSITSGNVQGMINRWKQQGVEGKKLACAWLSNKKRKKYLSIIKNLGVTKTWCEKNA